MNGGTAPGPNTGLGGAPVKVFVRTRPTSKFADRDLKVDADSAVVRARLPSSSGPSSSSGAASGTSSSASGNADTLTFRFDGVLHNSDQETVYARACSGVVRSVLEGYNATVFTYGQTGSGKTYTMSGPASGEFRLRGVIPRALREIFEGAAAAPEREFVVRVSYLEIYNEGMFDLLSSLPGAPQNSELVIATDASRGSTEVRGLHKPRVRNEEEALKVLFEGDANRAVSEHALNKRSSRSHCVFTVHVESRSRLDSQLEKVIVSKINLVDLAGSERIKKTGSAGRLEQEAKMINKSLTFLEQVVMALGAKNRDHVPFRTSKLTHVLRDALGGNSRTVMIANVFGEPDHLEDTVSTLRFAARVMKVTTEPPTVNVESDPKLLLKRYEREIRELKQELAMHDTLASRGKVRYDPYSEEQRHELRKECLAYLRGETDAPEVINLRHVREIFEQFRILYRNAEGNAEEALRAKLAAERAAGAGDAAGAGADAAGAASSSRPGTGRGGGGRGGGVAPLPIDAEGGVGDDSGGGFAVGKAPASARPANAVKPPRGGKAGGKKLSQREQREQAEREQQAAAAAAAAAATADAAAAAAPAANEADLVVSQPPAREEAFDHFRVNEEHGQELEERLAETKKMHKEKRRLVRDLTAEANRAQADVERLRAVVDAKSRARREEEAAAGGGGGRGGAADDDDEIVIDEEEYNAIRDLKAAKRTYRDRYDRISTLRAEVSHYARLVEATRESLLVAFDTWYADAYGIVSPELAVRRAKGAAASGAGRGAAHDPDAVDSDGDELDDAERFERMERKRLQQTDPDSSAYLNARRTARASLIKTGGARHSAVQAKRDRRARVAGK